MADMSPAKSFPESNITKTPEGMDIVLGKTLNDETKLELIAKLKEFPCLWETSSPAYKVDKKTKEKAMEELSENFNLKKDSLRSLIHGLRSGSRPLLLRIFSRMSRTRHASQTTKVNTMLKAQTLSTRMEREACGIMG